MCPCQPPSRGRQDTYRPHKVREPARKDEPLRSDRQSSASSEDTWREKPRSLPRGLREPPDRGVDARRPVGEIPRLPRNYRGPDHPDLPARHNPHLPHPLPPPPPPIPHHVSPPPY